MARPVKRQNRPFLMIGEAPTCYLDYAWCWYGNRRTVQGTIGYRF